MLYGYCQEGRRMDSSLHCEGKFLLFLGEGARPLAPPGWSSDDTEVKVALSPLGTGENPDCPLGFLRSVPAGGEGWRLSGLLSHHSREDAGLPPVSPRGRLCMQLCCCVLEQGSCLFEVFEWRVVVVQLLSCVQLFMTPWAAACPASLSFTISHSLLKLMSMESVMPSKHFILSHPLLLPPSIFPSIRVFSNESVLRIRWPKYWSFSFSISPSNKYSGLISFGIDWLDLLAVQGTLKCLLWHHSSKASILWCSAFFMV